MAINKSVGFSEEEIEKIQEMAKEAGMTVVAFIRQQSLLGSQATEVDELMAQTMLIGEIMREIHLLVNQNNPNRWLYAKDLHRIEAKLDEILSAQRKLLASD